ncbi:methionine ABC transporter permease [Nesterenkonia muleiensis]|uniref:methionine ABC transporter permease n=1 Tax=Nesterenkonia muleiensis TaxID=2282648 RepID=UPI000E71EF9F|nr:methionine ABC transporter permease [Nesterenkonia muleiensis]
MELVVQRFPDMVQALVETLAMVGVSIPLAVLIGTPIGIWLFTHAPGGIRPTPKSHAVVSGIVNMIRSFPFLILLIAILPFTQFVVGTTVGTAAAIVPLTVNAIPYFARLVEQNITQLGTGAVEASRAMGATRGQIIRNVLLVDARPAIIGSVTITTVSFISYSAMVGIVGGGGIGEFAIRYGYYRYETPVMLASILVMILLVTAVQWGGTRASRFTDKRVTA